MWILSKAPRKKLGPVCNVGWPGPSTINAPGKRWKTLFDERWITRVKQESHSLDSIGPEGILSSEPHWILPMSPTSTRLDTGWRLSTSDRAWLRRRQTQLFVTRSAILARRQSASGTSTEMSPAGAL